MKPSEDASEVDSGTTSRLNPGVSSPTRASKSSRGGGVQRGRRRGYRSLAQPSIEFKRLQGEATQAFVIDGDLEAALNAARRAVQINPEIFAAHSLLSEILLSMGRKEDSVGALFSGAHTKRDPKMWWLVASRIADLGGDDQLRVLAQACYCFNQVVKLDPTDYNARAERLRINLELGYRGRARKDCVAMLKIRQHDVGILRQLAELSRSTDDAEEALKYFTETIDHLVATDDPNNATELTWSLLNIYLELFDQPGRYGEALVKLRQVARWLLGRKDEAFWNQWDDDREWDLEDTPRRVEVGVFQLDRFGPDAYGRGLPLELRVKLGLFRLKNGLAHHSEAMQHFELLDPTDQSRTGKVFDYDDLYKDVADGLMQAGCYAEALKFYEALYDNVDSSKSSILPALANCYTFTGDLVKAEQCYKLLALTEGKYNDAVVHLARLFKASGRIREHDRLVLQLRKAGKLDLLRKYGLIGDTDGLATSDTRQAGPVTGEDVESNVENDNRLISRFGDSVRKQPFYAEKHKSLAERKEKDITDTRSIKDLLQKIAVLQVRVERGDEDALSQWLLAAELLFRDFENNSNRSVDQLYRTDLRKRKLFEEAELPSEGVDLPLPLFRDVSAEDWVDVFCRYALMLAQNNKSELCWQVFYAISESPLLNRDITLEHITHNCWIACALRLGNEDQLQNSLRWYIRKYTYTPGAYNLYTVVHGASGCRLLSQYNGGAAQKFILRQIKAIDYAVLTPQQRKLYRFSDLEISGWTRREEDGIRLPQEIIPTALATYAHMLLAGGSYTAALHYYFRCLAMIPDDPAINLAIAAAYVQHAFKRQSENRQMQIQTGLAFLHRYKAIRYRQGSTLLKQEAEFNEARFYHTIGLTHLAIPAYQRCLDMNQAVITDAKSRDGRSGYVENFSREAAYALQLIYAMNGNTALAIRISRTWLVF